MKEINEEVKLTLNLMQTDIDDGAHGELQGHLYSLLEIKRNELQRRLNEGSKPLTLEELKAGGWWCDDVSEGCQMVFAEKGLKTKSPQWSSEEGYKYCYLSGSTIRRSDVQVSSSTLKQIHRIGDEFFWGAVGSCDFDHCKNEAIGMVFDTKEVLGNNGCRNLRIHFKHLYCNQHMREPINYGKSN